MLKIAIISDIHHCPQRNREVQTILQKTIELVNAQDCNLVVELGDRVSDVDEAANIINMSTVANILARIKAPRQHILGNHDVKFTTPKQNAEIMGADVNMYSLIMQGYRLIFWNASSQLDYKNGFTELNDEDITWLNNELSHSKEPCIIFSHVPLDNDNMSGNYYFESLHHHAHYPKAQAERILDIITKCDKVIMCVNGHAHWQCFNKKNGINFITCPALSENFNDAENSLGFFGLLEVEDKKGSFKLIGTNEKTFSKINMEIK